MTVTEIAQDQNVPIGSKVIHTTTLEVGEVVGDSLGRGRCQVEYPSSTMWYPQPKRNIMLINN